MRTKTMRSARSVAQFLLFAMLFAAPTWAQAHVKDRMVERRAIEAAVWGMPIVNFQAMRDGLKKDAGVGYNGAHRAPKIILSLVTYPTHASER